MERRFRIEEDSIKGKSRGATRALVAARGVGAVADLFPTPARIGSARTFKHSGPGYEHSEQDRELLAGKAGFDDQSAELNLAVRVRFSLHYAHRTPYPALFTNIVICHFGPNGGVILRVVDGGRGLSASICERNDKE